MTSINKNLLLLMLFILLPGLHYAQQETGTVTGNIFQILPRAEKNASLQLAEVTTNTIIQEASPDAAGNFRFLNVPFGSYRLLLNEYENILSTEILVNSSVPVEILPEPSKEYQMHEIVVSAGNFADNIQRGSSKTYFTERSILQLPSFTGTKAIESVLINTPGIVPDEDGRMHARGEEAQIQYVIDGIPVTSNMTRVYSGLFNAGIIKTVNIHTGNLQPEYGVAASGILAITTKSGFDKPFFVNASAEAGSFNAKQAGIQMGGNIGLKSGLFLSFSTSSSDRYLDPIAEGDPINDNGTAYDFFGKLNTFINSKTEIIILGGYNKTNYSIPNGVIKIPPQDQKQDLQNYLMGFRINRALNSYALISFLGYHRNAEAKVTSSGLTLLTPADYNSALLYNEKFFIGGERKNQAAGAQIEFSYKPLWFSVPNYFKAGISYEQYPVSEKFSFAVTNTSLSDTTIPGGDNRFLPYDLTKNGAPFFVDQSKTGKRYSAYLQDQVIYNKWIFGGGIRIDQFKFLNDEFHFSPRLNAAYNVTDDIILHASYNRVVMQAPLENILVSSSDEARSLTGLQQGATPTSVSSEKEHNFELGAGYNYNQNLSFELISYLKLIKDFLVKVELGNTGVIFPVNLKEGFVAGGEIRARLNEWNNFSGYLSLSSCASYGLKPDDGSSPIAAGLIFGEEGENYNHPFAGEDMFPTEHNQLFTAVLNLNYDHPSGIFVGLNSRLDSGLPFDLVGTNGEALDAQQSREELRRRGYSDKVIDLLSLEPEEKGSPDKSVAPHIIFDFMAGYDLDALTSIPLRLTATVMNLFDTPFLYKFESSFGGTHFGYQRMFSLKLNFTM